MVNKIAMNYGYMTNGYVASLAQNPVYNTLPIAVEGAVSYTFIDLCLALMNLIDGARLRRYMVLQTTDLFWDMAQHDNQENEAHMADLNWFNNVIFDESCQLWQNRFNVMLDQTNDAEAITMLNLLGALHLNDDANINGGHPINPHNINLVNNNNLNNNLINGQFL